MALKKGRWAPGQQIHRVGASRREDTRCRDYHTWVSCHSTGGDTEASFGGWGESEQVVGVPEGVRC